MLVFRRRLMLWYRASARELPWRGTRDPYRTWVSEVMLQQTRVAAVLDHYERFLKLFPTVVALALAPESDVLAAWSGLGYYRRARSLHQAAQFLLRECAGHIPSTVAQLRTLPGVGDYTSAAIASIAFGERAAVLDGNVERVLLRILGRPDDSSAATRACLREQAEALVPHKRRSVHRNAAGDHNQAMMELGATLCRPRAPLCLDCPVFDLCATRGEHPTGQRARQQSRPAAYLLATRKRGARTEVLLARRGQELSLMPGMIELPPLPVDSLPTPEAPQPILRLRHSITNTNYYVEVYAQSGDAQPSGQSNDPSRLEAGRQRPPPRPPARRARVEENVPDKPGHSGHPGEPGGSSPAARAELKCGLLHLVPAAASTLAWYDFGRLTGVPLTGLARKILMRANLFSVAGPETPSRPQAPGPPGKLRQRGSRESHRS